LRLCVPCGHYNLCVIIFYFVPRDWLPLLGTPYDVDMRGAILFLEETGEELYDIDRMLIQVLLPGKLDNVAGIVFDKCPNCKPSDYKSAFNITFSLEEVLEDRLGQLDCFVVNNFCSALPLKKSLIYSGVKMNKTTSIVLGGGRGTRLFPLTHERAKPAVGFLGKYRLIDIPISNCINSGIKRIFVLTQFLSASLHRHIMQTYNFDTFTDGFLDILAAEQTPQGSDWFQGTADAVRATLKHTTYYDSENILILSSDHLYRMNYQKVIQFHQEQKADITICVYPVPKTEVSQFGLLKTNAEGIVTDYVEKPKEPKIIDQFKIPKKFIKNKGLNLDSNQRLVSMGIYVFNPSMLLSCLEKTKYADFGRDVIPAVIGKYKIVAYPFSDYWKDIGTISAFFEANIELTQANSQFKLYSPGWPIYTRTRSLPPGKVVQSEIRDSLLVEGSDITGARIVDSVIGVRSNIRQGSCLSEVVMLGADYFDCDNIHTRKEPAGKNYPPLGIGRHCTIERAIIDKNVRIGDGVSIHSKKKIKDFTCEQYCIRDGITIIPKGTILEPGTVI